MKIAFYRFFIVTVILFYGNYSHSQINDFQIWAGVIIKKDFTKKTSIQLDEQIRFFENVSRIKQFYTEATIEYQLNKHIDFSGNYRFIQQNEKSFFETMHRLSINVAVKQKISKFIFSLRSRYQKEFYPAWFYYENPLDPDQYLRNKLTIETKLIKKLDTYLSTEIYYQLDNPQGNIFDKARYETGLNYKINKKKYLNVFFMLQKQINVTKADADYILGVNYKIKI